MTHSWAQSARSVFNPQRCRVRPLDCQRIKSLTVLPCPCALMSTIKTTLESVQKICRMCTPSLDLFSFMSHLRTKQNRMPSVAPTCPESARASTDCWVLPPVFPRCGDGRARRRARGCWRNAGVAMSPSRRSRGAAAEGPGEEGCRSAGSAPGKYLPSRGAPALPALAPPPARPHRPGATRGSRWTPQDTAVTSPAVSSSLLPTFTRRWASGFLPSIVRCTVTRLPSGVTLS